jgi:hypothetical protein
MPAGLPGRDRVHTIARTAHSTALIRRSPPTRGAPGPASSAPPGASGSMPETDGPACASHVMNNPNCSTPAWPGPPRPRAPPQEQRDADRSGPSLPAGCVVLRLNRYYGCLRRPPGEQSTSGSAGYRMPRSGSKSAGCRAEEGLTSSRRHPRYVSAPHTPGSSSRLRFQALHRFHGLRPDLERLGTPLPARERGG